MKQKHLTQENAVSPVIGVMLMLVVTIIIAAIVSSFAGGMAGSVEKSPTVVISGTYSQTSGLVLTHMSGNTLSDYVIYVRPSEGFASSYYKLSWIPAMEASAAVWMPGEVRTTKAENIQPATDGAPNSGSNKGTSSYYGFNNLASIGKSMTVEIHKGGSVISSTEVKITA